MGIGDPRDHDLEHSNGDLLEHGSVIIDHRYQIIPVH